MSLFEKSHLLIRSSRSFHDSFRTPHHALWLWHYCGVIMVAMASQITSLTIVYSTVHLGPDQRKHQSFASLSFVRGIHRWPMISPHKVSTWWRHHVAVGCSWSADCNETTGVTDLLISAVQGSYSGCSTKYISDIKAGILMWVESPYGLLVSNRLLQINRHKSHLKTLLRWRCSSTMGAYRRWSPRLEWPGKIRGSERQVPVSLHDDVIKWKHFPCYWPFVRRIHRSPVNSPHKGQWRGALKFSLIWAWLNGWVNNREAIMTSL